MRRSSIVIAGVLAPLIVAGCGSSGSANVTTTPKGESAPVVTTSVPSSSASSVVPSSVATTIAAPTTTLGDVSTIALKDVQLALLVAGFEPGPADGIRTERTATAIRQFQTARSLPVTAVVDPATADALAAVLTSKPGRVVVRLSTQRAEVYDRSGALIGVWLVSTGKPGIWTPKGHYFVDRKLRTITFQGGENDRADWFTAFHGPFGFHGIPWIGNRSNRVPTALGIEPQSHGCVRMHDELAQFLYERLSYRSLVDVIE